MSFLDWTRLGSLGGVVNQDTGEGYPGNDLFHGLLCMAHGPSGPASAALVDTGLDGRVTIGSLTCSGGISTVPFYLESPMNVGITCMQSATSTLAGSGTSAYALMLDNINFSRTVKLVKMTDGASSGTGGGPGSTYILLASSQTQVWSPSSAIIAPYQLSLFWWCDPYFLRGTWLVGSLLEGPGATPVTFNLVHTGADAIVSTTSAGEGVYAFGSTNAGAGLFGNFKLDTFDDITVNGVPYPPP
jgi:hypothetical protein